MRKLLLLLVAIPAFAAVPATMVWELRATGTAGNVNGCGFDSASAGTGTDWTLQDAAHVNINNSAVVATGNTTTVTFTSGYTVATTDQGNVLHLISGTGAVAGWYYIQSVNTGAGTWTLDRTTGMSGAAITSGFMGGACSLNSTTDSALFGSAVAGNTFWMKSGSFSIGQTVNIPADGAAQTPIRLTGYNTSRGDNPTGSTRPLITLGINPLTLGNNWEARYFITTGSASTAFGSGTGNKIISVKNINTSTTAGRIAASIGSNSMYLASEAVSYRGTAINMSTTSVVLGSYLHDSVTCIMVAGTTNTAFIADNIITNCSTAGVNVSAANTASVTIENNTLYGAGATPSGTGLNFTTGATSMRAIGNIIMNWATGINHVDTTQTIGFDRYNQFFNNTADTAGWTTGPGSGTGVDPQIVGSSVLSYTTATTSNTGNTFTKSGATFVSSGITAGRDYLTITSTSGTAGTYGILSVDSETQLTLDLAPGISSGNVSAFVLVGRDFNIGTNLKALGFPGAFPGGNCTGYKDPGAVQRQEPSPTISAGGSLTCFQ